MRRRRKWWVALLLLALGFVIWRMSWNRYPKMTRDHSTGLVDRSKDTVRGGAGANLWPSHEPAFYPWNDIHKALQVEYDEGEDFVLTGKVTSLEGSDLSGANVSVHRSYRTSPRYEWPAPEIARESDGNGRYEVRLTSPLPTAVVSVRKDGYAAVESRWDMSGERKIVRNFILKRAPACVEGTLTANPEGEPVAGARITAMVTKTGFAADYFDATDYTVTDNAGRFALNGLPIGRLRVRASARAFLQAEESIVLSREGPCEQMALLLQPAKTVAIMVENTRGEPIPEAQCSLGTVSVWSDRNGRVELEVPLETRPFLCSVSAKGYRASTINIDPGRPPAVIVLSPADVVLKGRVISSAGLPVLGARVIAVGTSPRMTSVSGISEGMTQTDEAGRFAMPLSYPPVLQVRISKPGYAEYFLEATSRPVPMELEVRLQPATAGIFGRVVDEAGNPVRGFSVIAWDASWPGSQGYLRNYDDKNGRFLLTDVPPGIYQIKIQGESSALSSVRIYGVEFRVDHFYGPMEIKLGPRVK